MRHRDSPLTRRRLRLSFRRLRTRFAKALALLAALHLLGGHWLAIQSVAWVTMVVDYSQEASLGEALGKTFDGEHPCSLCKAVAEGRGEEQQRQDDRIDAAVKLVAVLAGDRSAAPRLGSALRFFSFVPSLQPVDDSLPSPPPRLA